MCACWLSFVIGSGPIGAQGRPAVDDEGRIVSFLRDIAPIWEARCLKCHGEKNPKNGFRIDLADDVLGYIEPGDAESSTLYTEYLLTDDEDLQMPPASHGGPLTAGELALIRVWIEEGADWPEDYAAAAPSPDVVGEVGDGPQPVPPDDAKSLPARLWAFQGYFHPATVHFPIALLLVGALFVVIGWRYPILGQQVALSCLWLGAISAVAASAMGWSFAQRRGYGSWSRIDTSTEIFWHRWSAVIVTIVAVVLAWVALAAVRRGSPGLHRLWRIGMLVLAAMVGAVGHQGGELTYGPELYQEAFDVLRGGPREPVPQPRAIENEVLDGELLEDAPSETANLAPA